MLSSLVGKRAIGFRINPNYIRIPRWLQVDRIGMIPRKFASIIKFAVNPTARRHLEPRKSRADKFLDSRVSLF